MHATPELQAKYPPPAGRSQFEADLRALLEALANKVYGGRMGNTQAGDGWLYRGRGPIQLTGRDNYAAVGALLGMDLINEPELMEQPEIALRATVAWWEDRIPDSFLGDVEKVSKRVNGGLIGLADREHLTELAGTALA